MQSTLYTDQLTKPALSAGWYNSLLFSFVCLLLKTAGENIQDAVVRNELEIHL